MRFFPTITSDLREINAQQFFEVKQVRNRKLPNIEGSREKNQVQSCSITIGVRMMHCCISYIDT